MSRLQGLAIAIAVATSGSVLADAKSKLAKETAEYVLRKFGKEAGEEGVETLARKVEVLTLKYGDDAAVAVKKVGPRAFRVVEEAGENGGETVKLMARHGDGAIWVVAQPSRMAIFAKYGDDAAEAMIKHGEVAEPLLRSIGKPAAGAFNAVSTKNGRRLAMMAEDGELAKIGESPELLSVIAKYGDAAMDFVWRHKGALAVGTTLAAFLADPQPFIDGTADITKIVAENVAAPIAAVPSQVAGEAAKRTNWTIVMVAVVLVVGALLGARSWSRRRSNRRAVGRAADE